MRKSAILLTILLAASVATAADAKKKKMAPAKPMVAYTNEQSASLVGAAVGNWVPGGTMQGAAAPAKAKKVAHHHKKKMKKA